MEVNRIERFGKDEVYRLIAQQGMFFQVVIEQLNQMSFPFHTKLPWEKCSFKVARTCLNQTALSLATLTDGPYFIRRLLWEMIDGVGQAQHKLGSSEENRWRQVCKEADLHSCREVALVARVDPEHQTAVVESYWKEITRERAKAREVWLLQLIRAFHFAHLFIEASDSTEKIAHETVSQLVCQDTNEAVRNELQEAQPSDPVSHWYKLKMVEVIGESIGIWVYENISGEPVTRDADWENLRDFGIDRATYRRALNPIVWAMEG
ncbi:MAG: hypothetical protein AB7F31_03840 [Parachlamydiales bacterium]